MGKRLFNVDVAPPGGGRGLVTDRLITAAELAESLALSTSTVLDWFEAGRLPGFKLGRVVRFRESEVSVARGSPQRAGDARRSVTHT